MLKDLLVIAGEPPLTAHTIDASNEYVLVKQKISVRPCVVGTSTQTLHLKPTYRSTELAFNRRTTVPAFSHTTCLKQKDDNLDGTCANICPNERHDGGIDLHF